MSRFCLPKVRNLFRKDWRKSKIDFQNSETYETLASYDNYGFKLKLKSTYVVIKNKFQNYTL